MSSGSFALTATATDTVTGQAGQKTGSFTVGGSGPAVISPAAGPWSGNGLGTRTLTVNPSAAGNLLVLAVSASGAGMVSSLSTGVSGGGVTTWQRATGYVSTGDHALAELWLGVVTAPGAATVTVANASMASEWNRFWAREFTASGASLAWQAAAASPAAAVTSASPSGTGTVVTCPALTGSGLYVAAVTDIWGNLTAGTAPGFTTAVTDGHLLTVWGLSPSGAPGGTSSDSGENWDAAAVLITASGTPVALSVATSSLPAGVTGQGYSASLSAAGGVPPYAWALTAGTLPAGLSLSALGALSGTPTAAGTSSFTVKVTDSAAHTASAAFTVTVTASPPVLFTGTYPPGGSWHATAMDPDLSMAGNTGLPYVDLNVWGPVSGETLGLSVYSARSWALTASMNNGSGSVTCFPNTGISYPVGLPWSSYSYLISGWDETMDASQNQIASACYDNWFDNTLVNPVTNTAVNEVMLHFDFRNRGAGPWYAEGVQFGGYTVNGIAIPVTTWNLAYIGGFTGLFWNLVDSGGNITNMPIGAVDLLAMNQYLVAHGFLSAACTMGISLGYEICDTQGAARNFRYNSMWCYGG